MLGQGVSNAECVRKNLTAEYAETAEFKQKKEMEWWVIQWVSQYSIIPIFQSSSLRPPVSLRFGVLFSFWESSPFFPSMLRA